MDRLGYAAPTLATRALRLEGGTSTPVEEMIAEETPITLAFNGVSHAVMMASPSDLEDFAVGFSLTEGLVERREDLARIDLVRYSRGVEIQIETTVAIAGAARGRRLAGRTGCGICGKEDVEQVLRALPSVDSAMTFSPEAIARAMRELSARQPLNDATGATHAAGWAGEHGEIILVREDVGRHNALDKLVGALTRAGTPVRAGFVVLTSRGSFELVQKVAILGASLLATVSAPTGLAIRVASDTGITLAGFARDGRVTVYSHPARLAPAV